MVIAPAFSVALAILTVPLQASPQKPVITITVDYIKPPGTMKEMIQSVDAVILGEVLGSEPVSYQTVTSGPPRVFTKHTIRILEIVKSGRDLGAVGTTVGVLQAAGEIDTGDKLVRVNGGYRTFGKGEQYVLFLEWNTYLAQYELAYGPLAIFNLKGGRIETPARQGVAFQSQGKMASEFLAELRAAKE